MSERIKIVHVIHDLGFGGAQRVLANLVLGRTRERFDASVISLFASCPGLDVAALRDAGVAVRFLDKKPGFDLKAFRELGRLLREERPSVVHTHGYVVRYVWPYRLVGVAPRLVHTVHNLAEQDSGRPYWINSLCYRLGANTVAVGEAVAASVKRLHGVDVRRVILNGIDVKKVREAAGHRAELRAKWGRKEDDVVFFCAASLTPKKNHALLLSAFAELQKSASDTYLVLAGDGEERVAVEAAVEAEGLGDRVQLLGNRDDVPALLHAADVFVLSSDREGVPLSCMEAMAAGRPVVATRVGGTPEVVRDFVDGLLVEPGDVEGFAEAMRCVAVDRARRSVMGSAALRRAEEEFGVRRMIDRYEAFYELIAGGKGGAGA